MRVLLSGYTCDPAGGSEAANTWYTGAELARAGARVHLLTRASDRPRVEPALESVPGLSATFLSDESKVNRGQVGVYARYLAFQRRVAAWAREHSGWDVGHHVSWGSINHPVGLAGQVDRLIVGPVGGGQTVRPELVQWLDGPQGWNRPRNAVLRYGYRLNPWSRQIARCADVLFVANEETRQLAARLGARRVEFMPPDGVRAEVSASTRTDPHKIVWIGRFLPIKAAGLALAAFRETLRIRPETRLVFVGDGPAAPMIREHAADLVAAGAVGFTGALPWKQAQAELASASVHLFTSVRDSFSAQVLEAAALGVPTVGLRIGGLAMVADGSAFVAVDPDSQDLPTALGAAVTTFLSGGDGQRARADALAFAGANTYAEHARRLMAAAESL